MIEFETLCYLQNQKTGCTFVETMLRKHCSEGIVRYEKHRVLPRRKPGKFYFISVREPLDAYGSLFRFGLDKKGELFMRLRATGHAALYARGMEGFAAWLEFVLDARHASLVFPAAGPELSAALGLQSWRYLRLAALNLDQGARTLTSPQALRDYAQEHKVVSSVVRYECMQQDLSELVQGQLAHAFADPAEAVRWLQQSPRINASETQAPLALRDIAHDLLERLMQREWYLYGHFYNADGSLRTPQLG